MLIQVVVGKLSCLEAFMKAVEEKGFKLELVISHEHSFPSGSYIDMLFYVNAEFKDFVEFTWKYNCVKIIRW